MRSLVNLRSALVAKGFSEIYGIGLYGRESDDVFVDVNTGFAYVYPYVDAPRDMLIGVAEIGAELEPLIEKALTTYA
ncbi:hypothetical protein A6E01_20170 (plasmid) [Vibrio breoganii]|uniref:Uncharacterized protein n=1 Tax=Vibrio breoganii TaxID=553239 RepID=A0AAN0XZG6_9VIBR|nr:hypothetical protein [Vibrio breoganii]ANO35531.1 hypothetical protein A6E01_20170 [Vibrio breoganii]